MNPASITDLTVLVVEPYPGNQRLLDVILRRAATCTLMAADDDEARQLLSHRTVDVVVLEPQGTKSLNWDLLEEVKVAGIPTVVVTSRADQWVLDEARHRGAVAVITKPFHGDDLVSILASVTHQSAATQPHHAAESSARGGLDH